MIEVRRVLKNWKAVRHLLFLCVFLWLCNHEGKVFTESVQPGELFAKMYLLAYQSFWCMLSTANDKEVRRVLKI